MDDARFAGGDVEDSLHLDLEGFEGPLHVMLDLARAHKIDLARLSLTHMADQFLAFVEDARGRRIELAGEYLVMAAWLTWLKSRLLLPKPERPADDPDPEFETARLKARLEKLAMARAAAAKLESLAQLGRDVFVRGDPQTIAVHDAVRYQANLSDLLHAYCARRTRRLLSRHRVSIRAVYPIAAARARLKVLAPQMNQWTALETITADVSDSQAGLDSVTASTLGAALELVRDQALEARQDQPFASVYLRARRRRGARDE